MQVLPWICVALGAAPGAWLRWQFGLWLNPLFPHWPLGTLLANVSGGFLIGIFAALFQAYPGIDPLWRLFWMTGFLGAFTTFSSFSLETVNLLQQGRLMNAFGLIGLHLILSLIGTFAGFSIVHFVLKHL